jgi:transposase
MTLDLSDLKERGVSTHGCSLQRLAEERPDDLEQVVAVIGNARYSTFNVAAMLEKNGIDYIKKTSVATHRKNQCATCKEAGRHYGPRI